jgi:hypothetical protein
MSQSATYYRISKAGFDELADQSRQIPFDIQKAKGNITLQGTFIALVYLLAKGQGKQIGAIMKEISNPSNTLGEIDFSDLSFEETAAYLQNNQLVPFIDPERLKKLNDHLNKYDENGLRRLYNPDELNEAGIYPDCWHNDDSEGLAFNFNHIVGDFKSLKELFRLANEHQDKILVFIG